MTVTTTNVESTYVGDGVQDTFAITFEFKDDNQIYVTVDGVQQSSPGDFAVVGSNVEFVVAPPASDAIVIYRQSVFTQAFDGDNNNFLDQEALNDTLDRQVMMIQELNAKVADLEARVTTLEA